MPLEKDTFSAYAEWSGAAATYVLPDTNGDHLNDPQAAADVWFEVVHVMLHTDPCCEFLK